MRTVRTVAPRRFLRRVVRGVGMLIVRVRELATLRDTYLDEKLRLTDEGGAPHVSSACREPSSCGCEGDSLMKNKSAFFDAATITFLRGVLDDAWAHLLPGQTAVSRSLLAERTS
jgi:hypothetical protein